MHERVFPGGSSEWTAGSARSREPSSAQPQAPPPSAMPGSPTKPGWCGYLMIQTHIICIIYIYIYIYISRRTILSLPVAGLRDERSLARFSGACEEGALARPLAHASSRCRRVRFMSLCVTCEVGLLSTVQLYAITLSIAL